MRENERKKGREIICVLSVRVLAKKEKERKKERKETKGGERMCILSKKERERGAQKREMKRNRKKRRKIERKKGSKIIRVLSVCILS